MAKYSQKEKDAYLKYFEEAKKRKTPLRDIHTFSLWRKRKKMGGSRQTQGQLRSLSSDDMAEIYKKFGTRR
jgi:hypothetical protein